MFAFISPRVGSSSETKRPIRLAIVGVTLALFAGAASFVEVRHMRAPAVPPSHRLANSLADQTETQIVLVYLGSERCRWCQRPETRAAVVAARRLVAVSATAKGYRFRNEGIDVDGNAKTGDGHLMRIGGFDEVAIGGGWSNPAAAKYVSGELAGPSGTPQLIVYRRNVAYPGPKNGELPVVSQVAVLVRKVGLPEITAWVGGGAVIPQLAR